MPTAPLDEMYVEGVDDINVISNLLKIHGIDTRQGKSHLNIKAMGSIDQVLLTMTESVRAATDRAVGFVIDIDVEVTHRWDAVKARLRQLKVAAPESCPPDGFIGAIENYPKPFGVWLMPDCKTDGKKLEDLLATLIPAHEPLWNHAKESVRRAAEIVDEANKAGAKQWPRFRDCDRIKSQVRTWLAFQREPGVQLGAAINDRILGCDSHEAIAFLRWVKRLYGFNGLNLPQP